MPYKNYNLKQFWMLTLFIVLFSLFLVSFAQEEDKFGYLEGKIIAIDGLNATISLRSGEEIEAELWAPLPGDTNSGSVPAFKVGQQVELYYSPSPSGGTKYNVSDWIRRPALAWLLGLFLLVSVAVAQFKGLRAFISTAASLIIVVMFIVPRILDGGNPMIVSLLGVGGILILAIYFVHGLNWSTTAALIGTFIAVIFTMLLGIGFTEWAHLTGFGSDEALMINSGASQVNLKGLLLAGLLIGALGALTDITIVQASVIRELAHVNPNMSTLDLYSRGMNVGTDHVGSLVNTLVLAYTGAALPLFILLSINDFSIARALNIEIVASEVVHTLVGSIGLVLAVPLTTIIAALMFKGDKLPMVKGELDHAHHH